MSPFRALPGALAASILAASLAGFAPAKAEDPNTGITHGFLATGGETYIRDGRGESPGDIPTPPATAGSCPTATSCSP